MNVLVTGADGFVGRWLVPRLRTDGHAVTAAVGAGGGAPGAADVRRVTLELRDAASVRAAVREPPDAVVHLAAMASGAAAARDPGEAWEVNAAGTARLVAELAGVKHAGLHDPLVLIVSTSEVYGRGPCAPRRESDAPQPTSPYGASKLGAEVAALEAWRRTGLRVVIARPFAHTGPGQAPRYVVPGFAQRLREASRLEARVVKVGNLEPVREFLHVRDVVDAYVRLLAQGVPGEVYNVASGRGVRLEDLFAMMADLIGVRAIPEPDADLVRPNHVPHLVGDPAKLHDATGWVAGTSLEDTLREVLDAQAD